MDKKHKEEIIDKYLQYFLNKQKGIHQEELEYDIPKKLYKYREFNRNNINALKSKKAYFNLAKNWNDPFDTAVRFELNKVRKEITNNESDFFKKISIQMMKSMFENHPQYHKIDLVFESVFDAVVNNKKISKDNVEKMLDKENMTDNEYETANTALATVYKHASGNSRIGDSIQKIFDFLVNSYDKHRNLVPMYSLSENNDIQTQWVFYANNYEGYCIEYDLNALKNSYTKEIVNNTIPILYGEKPDLDFFSYITDSFKIGLKSKDEFILQKSKEVLISTLTKDSSWEKENEWRIMLPDEYGSKKGLYKFDCCVAIYLGYRMKKRERKNLINIAKKNKWDIYEQVIDKYASRFSFEKIEYNKK